jgi:hypothetical protein
MCAIVFNDAGDVLEVRRWPIQSEATSKDLSFDKLRQVVATEVDEFRRVMGQIDETIHIKRFWLPQIGAGISDLADELLEYVVSPDSLHENERQDLGESLTSWKEEDLFAFWWNQSFYVDSQGVVATS